jgi:hypothetical protein
MKIDVVRIIKTRDPALLLILLEKYFLKTLSIGTKKVTKKSIRHI